ncbi:MAG: response regulator [Vicingaceae bacterium]|nr:response regulator [Flavobacteriales bacterium]MDF1676274.1 response regulator [Vicingaceae bacterium]
MKRILVIEDETNLRNTLVDLLEINGFEVITAKDGEEGVKKVIEIIPDVVLCDVNMPKMNGFEVLDLLTNILDELQIPPFIFLTAKTDRESTRYGMSLGAEDYITKPFNSQEVLKAIDVRIDKRNKIEQLVLNIERKRISGELHNGIQNIMVAANMGIKSIVMNNKNIPVQKLEVIKKSSDLIAMAIKETRSLSYNIKLHELEEKGLKKYIEKIISTLLITNDISFDYHSTIEELKDKQQELSICRFIQEIITNALKHSKANKISLSITGEENNLYINYKDNGVGFDLEEVLVNDGLSSLKQKAEELKGVLHIESSPKKGVVIDFSIN